MKERLKLISRRGGYETTGPGFKHHPHPFSMPFDYVYNKLTKEWYKRA